MKMAAKKEKEEKKILVVQSATDLQRLKLEKLMKNPTKEVFIPDKPKDPSSKKTPEFIRNVWGSSAGAGSGDFHVYRGVRRREYARQKFNNEKAKKDELDENFKNKVTKTQEEEEKKASKKRAKRLKKKQRQKDAKKRKKDNKTTNTDEEESEEEEDDDDEKEEDENDKKEDDNEDDKKEEDEDDKKEGDDDADVKEDVKDKCDVNGDDNKIDSKKIDANVTDQKHTS